LSTRRHDLRAIVAPLLVTALCGVSGSAQELIGAQPTVTATGARALVDACLAYAKTNRQRVGIAVVDPHGNLLDYHTMEGTNVIAGESAILKAKTAVRWRQPTEELNARVLKEENVAPVWIGDFPQRGGVPIFVKGEIVGGMGIGGGGGDECAKAAIAAVLKNATTTPPSTAP
jgi:glc operon protein GlcG